MNLIAHNCIRAFTSVRSCVTVVVLIRLITLVHIKKGKYKVKSRQRNQTKCPQSEKSTSVRLTEL